ncbi:unnamed protein product [Coffea canephora]|uniref:DH200=94 genomic scaffold, scaffold_7265 n=1 Tax=Coffea canephora TaxID=49390 RepID=A0A068VM37_COFCA|nr:unnamed protein product [Coffea canephora]
MKGSIPCKLSKLEVPLVFHYRLLLVFPSMASGNIGNDWSSGLCDCIKDCRSCCLTCWCPCITFGRVAEIVDKGQSCKYKTRTFLIVVHH